MAECLIVRHGGGSDNTPSAAPNLQIKTVEPTKSAQNVTPDNGYDGLSKVTVSAVTKNIDANITAENIRLNKNILGVYGTYAGVVGMMLTTAAGVPGSTVDIYYKTYTGNLCNAYFIDITHNEALTCTSVTGCYSHEINGNVVTAIGLTGMSYIDGNNLMTLKFRIPEDAVPGTQYDIIVSEIRNFHYNGGEFSDKYAIPGKIFVI